MFLVSFVVIYYLQLMQIKEMVNLIKQIGQKYCMNTVGLTMENLYYSHVV